MPQWCGLKGTWRLLANLSEIEEALRLERHGKGRWRVYPKVRSMPRIEDELRSTAESFAGTPKRYEYEQGGFTKTVALKNTVRFHPRRDESPNGGE